MSSLKFRLKKIDVTKNCLSYKIKHNDLMSKKYKKACNYLNYVEHLLILSSTITGCVSISSFALLVCVPVVIICSAVGLKMCTITAEIKNYKSIIKKKMKKHDKIVLIGKSKLDAIEVLISKALMGSHINHDEFVSVNNVLKEYNEIKKGIKNIETFVEHTI